MIACDKNFNNFDSVKDEFIYSNGEVMLENCSSGCKNQKRIKMKNGVRRLMKW